jgi:hypothetical protein
MRTATAIVVALLPVLVPLVVWKAALAVNTLLGCEAVGKNAQACIRAGIDFRPALEFGAWWGMILWIPGLIVTGALLESPIRRLTGNRTTSTPNQQK